MKILIITDAWKPQVNGVVRTYEHLDEEFQAMGHTVQVIGPSDFAWRVPMPGYSEIELALCAGSRLRRLIHHADADTLHIATEGPLGRAARRYCHRHKIPFTTAYHTQFPAYVSKRVALFLPFMEKLAHNYVLGMMRRFHNDAAAIMIATKSLEDELHALGFTAPMHRLTRGVNFDLFTPERKQLFSDHNGPVALYVGRVAIEKNLDAFLGMDWEGTKVVVGDGPDLQALQAKYPKAVFTGRKTGADLAACFQSADLFVFPSRTDTFGMVLTEAMACGLPLAAYPVMGPLDIVTEPMLGALDEDLATAARKALNAPGTRQERADHARHHYTWRLAAEQFISISEHSGAILNKMARSNIKAAPVTSS